MNPMPVMLRAIAAFRLGSHVEAMRGVRTESAKIFRTTWSLLEAAQRAAGLTKDLYRTLFDKQCEIDAAYCFGREGRWPCESARHRLAIDLKAQWDLGRIGADPDEVRVTSGNVLPGIGEERLAAALSDVRSQGESLDIAKLLAEPIPDPPDGWDPWPYGFQS